ncbi:SIMPL domain-containing protein [Flavisolibacter nicotianae]|uniref:SIMPL domain-containing protein n=1 Tax=Flavisolibacter nicotianae TaxID=2364882 RepID=UPI000EADFB23|nr:SIMPL domain-containing protein [Flavisolibacter nicotianae]
MHQPIAPHCLLHSSPFTKTGYLKRKNVGQRPPYFTTCLFFAALVFLACCNPAETKKETIKVAGEGKIRVKPNLVILTLNVSFTQPRMVDAVRMTQGTVDSVVSILEHYGSKENDIKTSSISANKDYNYDGRRPVFTGYQASQSIDFVLNDIEKFTELTGKLLETKINSISGIQFGHSKSDSLFREADLLAYDDALKSANKLCSRANVQLGKLVYMSNTVGTNGDEETFSSGEQINTYSKAYGGRGFKISPEVLEFKRKVISEYEIAN